MIKYINPNLLVVATVSPPSSARNLDSDNLTNQSVTEVTLTLSLLDTVTGKVVRRITHDGGVGPVHLAVIENFVIATYWNSEVNQEIIWVYCES